MDGASLTTMAITNGFQLYTSTSHKQRSKERVSRGDRKGKPLLMESSKSRTNLKLTTCTTTQVVSSCWTINNTNPCLSSSSWSEIQHRLATNGKLTRPVPSINVLKHAEKQDCDNDDDGSNGGTLRIWHNSVVGRLQSSHEYPHRAYCGSSWMPQLRRSSKGKKARSSSWCTCQSIEWKEQRKVCVKLGVGQSLIELERQCSG